MNYSKEKTLIKILNGLEFLESSGCWIYDLSVKNGYPVIYTGVSQLRIDKFLYSILVEKVLKKTDIKKKCKTKNCVNPLHYELIKNKNKNIIDEEDYMYCACSDTYIVKPTGYDRKIHTGDDYVRLLEKQTKEKAGDDWYDGKMYGLYEELKFNIS